MGRDWHALGLLALFAVSGCSGDASANADDKAAPAPRPKAVAGARAAIPKLAGDTLEHAPGIDVARETFVYQGGSRDPFNSLMTRTSSGPELVDLQLVGVYENMQAPLNSVVVLREKVGNKRHKLRIGDRLGRMRLAQIRSRDAVFMVQDFGSERQETLSLPKQEDGTP